MITYSQFENILEAHADLTNANIALRAEVLTLLAFIHALTVQATPGTDYYCPHCDRHDPELDGRLILDKHDSQEAHTYTSPPRAENAEMNEEREG